MGKAIHCEIILIMGRAAIPVLQKDEETWTYVLGDGQQIETKLAADLDVKVFRVFEPILPLGNPDHSDESLSRLMHSLFECVDNWQRGGREDMSVKEIRISAMDIHAREAASHSVPVTRSLEQREIQHSVVSLLASGILAGIRTNGRSEENEGSTSRERSTTRTRNRSTRTNSSTRTNRSIRTDRNTRTHRSKR